VIYLAVITVLLLAGCSPVSRIANNTNEIRTQAQLLADHGMAINDPVVVTGATRIDTLAAGIHIALGGVEDKTPAWMSMLTWIAIAAVIVAVVVLLAQTGLGTMIRLAIGWLPRKQRQDADLAASMLDSSKPEDAREYIAARRFSDPYFDAAWKQARAGKKETP
jgi:outer membrane murein-binding lipoprotein Lpp